MGFESTLGWTLLYREELREEPIIDAHRYTAVVAIHVHIIVTHHGQSFKAPPAYQICTREASAAPAASLCAGHVQQPGGVSPLPNLMEVKG